jgi:hypothetical protein
MLVAERRRADTAQAKTEKFTKTLTVLKTPTVSEKGTVSETLTVRGKLTIGKSRIRHAARVQDGHSTGEQCLYAAMWQAGSPGAGGRSRLVTAGWDRLGMMANLHWTNARSAAFGLIGKLAIEVVAPENSNTRTGRTYRVWGWVALLERRRAAGMEWYVKTRGVEFVRPPAEHPAAQAKWDAHHAETPTVSEKGTVSETLTVGKTLADTVSEKLMDTVSDSLTLSFNNLKEEESTLSSSCSEAVAGAVRKLAPDADDEFVATLIDKCRAVTPDATAEEIAHFVRAKGEKALNGRRVSSLTGFLLTAVPKCLTGTLLEDYRAGKRQEKMREITAWREIVTDPASPDELRQVARDELIRLGDEI